MHCHRQYSPKVCHICLQDVTLLLCKSLICFVFLCRLVSVNQRRRIECVYFYEMCSTPAVTWMRWFVCTSDAHIESNALTVLFILYHDPKRCAAIEFGHFLFLCVCLPLTCCQRGNSQHPATLPQATSWCATVRVVSWINMLMYKGMSVG